MAFSRSGELRRPAVSLSRLTGVALLGAGAMLVLAWQMGWWATLAGVTLCAAWIIGSAGFFASRAAPPVAAAALAGVDPDPTPLRPLLDQVPVPLVQVDAAGAHAINRAARALFDTDDRILPSVPALIDRSARRLHHEGRRWRIDAVDTAIDHRLIVLIDVEAEEQAAQAHATAEMIDILGHELLNGLSPIVSLADSAITASERGDAALPHILTTLARRVEGLEGFTRAYRTLSRLPDPILLPVKLSDLANDLGRLFASRFGTSVSLVLDVPSDRSASVDRDQLTQAVWALLQNGAEAALATSEPAQVALMFVADADRLTIRVTDTGAGIAAPDRARIFRPFFTTKSQGSGIGLSLAHRIAQAHGGALRLLPIEETTFEMSLAAPAR